MSVRRSLSALALGGFGIGTGEFVILGLLPNVATSFHASVPHTGLLISAYALGVVLGAPLVTPISVRFPHRRFLLLALGAMAVTNIGSALAPSFGSLLVIRFLSGLPHGAYFGVASVLAGGLVPADRRSRAMAFVFAGLTLANVIGVPATTFIGQHLGWRLVFGLVAGIELAAMAAIVLVVAPADPDAEPVRLTQELRAFANPQIWSALAIAIVGGSGLFCTFSYITPMLIHVSHFSRADITPLLVLFGVGMTAGNLIGARFADRFPWATLYVALGLEVIVAVLYYFALHSQVTALFGLVIFPACALAVLPTLQNRIIALAGGAPNIAAASIHSAFNIANSLGAWVGGIVIAAGLGYAAPNFAAAGFAVLGLLVVLQARRVALRAVPSAAAAPAPTEVGVPR